MLIRKIFYNIFPFLKLKNKHLKWYKKLSIYIEILIMLSVVYWILLLFFYKNTFPSPYKEKQLFFYQHSAINCFQTEKISKYLLRIKDILNKHNIDLNTIQANIYLINNDSEYFLTMPPFSFINYYQTMAFATLDNIYFKYVDIYSNESFLDKSKENSKSFELILSHELVHIWQEKKFGFFKFIIMPEWVKEGYAMYVTEEDAIVYIKYFLEEDTHYNKRNWYELWGLMIKHAIEKMHKTVDELHKGKVDYDEVLNSLLKEYNITK